MKATSRYQRWWLKTKRGSTEITEIVFSIFLYFLSIHELIVKEPFTKSIDKTTKHIINGIATANLGYPPSNLHVLENHWTKPNSRIC